MEYTSGVNNSDYENKLLKSEVDLKSKDQCNNFKSSYARSLSFNKYKAKSLNLSVNHKRVEDNCESSVYTELDNDGKYKSVKAIDDTKTQQKKNHLLIDEIHQLNQKNATENSYFDSILLQTQVNTLQWQLKQVESTRQMYQTVLEEVVRFLKKCYQHLNMLMEPWPRSKSEKNIVNNDKNDENVSKLEPIRAQSTINLHNMPCLLEREFHKVARTGYNTNNKFNLDTEKMSHEAFRLYRTTENLINMQGPNLKPVLPNNADVTELKPYDLIGHSNKAFDTVLNGAEKTRLLDLLHTNKNSDRVSFRSCTTDSIHSNSPKSSIMTDEDMQNTSKTDSITTAFGVRKQLNTTPNKSLHTMLPNCIDVESGFSSMNSFQEIGLPLVNSTQIPMTTNFNTILISNKESNDELIKTELQTDCKIERKWSSLPMSSKKSPAPLFEFKCDDSLKVLWV